MCAGFLLIEALLYSAGCKDCTLLFQRPAVCKTCCSRSVAARLCYWQLWVQKLCYTHLRLCVDLVLPIKGYHLHPLGAIFLQRKCCVVPTRDWFTAVWLQRKLCEGRTIGKDIAMSPGMGWGLRPFVPVLHCKPLESQKMPVGSELFNQTYKAQLTVFRIHWAMV